MTTIRITYGPVRKKPKAGDEKVIKGVLHVRQQVKTSSGGYLVAHGKPVWEWVVAGSDNDRDFKPREWRKSRAGGAECQ